MLPPGLSYGVGSISCWYKSLCKTENGHSDENHCLLLKVNTLNERGQARRHPSPPTQAPQFTRIPHYDWWTIGGPFLVEHLATNNTVKWTLNQSDE